MSLQTTLTGVYKGFIMTPCCVYKNRLPRVIQTHYSNKDGVVTKPK